MILTDLITFLVTPVWTRMNKGETRILTLKIDPGYAILPPVPSACQAGRDSCRGSGWPYSVGV